MLKESDIEAIRPDSRVKYYADGARTGLKLRVYPSGAKKWVRRTEAGGRVRETVIGEWPAMPAAEARRRTVAAVKTASGERLTFEQAAKQWHKDRILPRYRASAGIVWRYLERDCAKLFPKRLDTITQAQVAAVIEAKRADGENAASKLLRLLRKLFAWAAVHQLVAVNPAAALTIGVMGIDTADPRDRLASDDELRTVWNLPAPHGPMLRFVLLTACRVGEARAAEPDQVDADGVWTIAATKNGRSHRLPLTKTATALLATGWELRSPEALYQALHLRVPGLNPHDLRRTAATRMRELGVSGDVVEAILNHSPPKLQRTYQLPNMIPEMRAALVKWERALLRIVRAK